MQSVPTKERLLYGGIIVESILCPICSQAVKTNDHLFENFIDLLTYGVVSLFGGVFEFLFKCWCSLYFLGPILSY